MLSEDAPFYLAVNNMANNFDLHSWYKNAPQGKNKLGSAMRDIARDADLKGKYSNHSLRKTGITNLLQAGVAPTLITQVSGHKNVGSLKNY